jgi:hypothetical protein
MLFKVRLDVIRKGYSKEEIFQTMMDSDTISNCTSDNRKKIVESAWLNSMFPGADKLRIKSCVKI